MIGRTLKRLILGLANDSGHMFPIERFTASSTDVQAGVKAFGNASSKG